MARVHCPDCGIDVVTDPVGRCPEGHLVTASADRPPVGDEPMWDDEDVGGQSTDVSSRLTDHELLAALDALSSDPPPPDDVTPAAGRDVVEEPLWDAPNAPAPSADSAASDDPTAPGGSHEPAHEPPPPPPDAPTDDAPEEPSPTGVPAPPDDWPDPASFTASGKRVGGASGRGRLRWPFGR